VLGQSSPQENDNVQHKFPQIKSSAHFPSRRWKDLLISNAHEFWRAGEGKKWKAFWEKYYYTKRTDAHSTIKVEKLRKWVLLGHKQKSRRRGKKRNML